MTQPETVLLEIIDTGPCERCELQHEAPSLITHETDEVVRPSQINDMLDTLNGLGHIGYTGSKLDTVVVSRLGQSILNSN